MAKYDPKRGRPGRVVDDEEPAPVDEILHETAADAAPEPVAETLSEPVLEAPPADVVDLRRDAVDVPPVRVVIEPSPVDPVVPADRGLVKWIAIGAASAAAIALLVGWRRSR